MSSHGRGRLPEGEAQDRQAGPALVGAIIGGLFGVAWTQWGAAGLPRATSGAVRVAGVVVGLVVVVWSARLLRSAPRANGMTTGAPPGRGSRSMFSSGGFWLVLVLEIVALRGGTALLDATGHEEYRLAWVAIAVGLHFVALARLVWSGFYRLAAALVTAGIAGTIVGIAGGGKGGITSVSGLSAAVSLFAAGGLAIAGARGASRRNLVID